MRIILRILCAVLITVFIGSLLFTLVNPAAGLIVPFYAFVGLIVIGAFL